MHTTTIGFEPHRDGRVLLVVSLARVESGAPLSSQSARAGSTPQARSRQPIWRTALCPPPAPFSTTKHTKAPLLRTVECRRTPHQAVRGKDTYTRACSFFLDDGITCTSSMETKVQDREGWKTAHIVQNTERPLGHDSAILSCATTKKAEMAHHPCTRSIFFCYCCRCRAPAKAAPIVGMRSR